MRTDDIISSGRNWLYVERAVEEFERAYSMDEGVDPTVFCPSVDDPLYLAIATEIVRSSLELSTQTDRPKRLNDFEDTFPAIFADASSLANIAFEEYRIRCQLTDSVSAEEYRTKYGIDTSSWSVRGGKRNAPQFADESQFGQIGATNVFASLPLEAQAAAQNLGFEAGRYPEPGVEAIGFRFVRELGRGAFSRVYLAEQKDLAGRFVAIKLSTKMVAEAQTLAKLQHTNIVPVYSVHQAGRFHAVCMPYLGSVTLHDVLKKLRAGGALPLSAEGLVSTVTDRLTDSASSEFGEPPSTEHHQISHPLPGQATASFASPLDTLREKTHVGAALWICAELADGLTHAHERGIVHRDIKPANVLLSDEGRPMLLDFNLSGDANKTGGNTEIVGGTPSHMSPEQLAAVAGDQSAVDARSDIYSLGLILYELLTGESPHKISSAHFREQISRLRELRSRPTQSARSVNPAITPAVDAIISKCLATNPSDRYLTARQLREDILLHLDDLPLKHAGEPSVTERIRKKYRRNTWIKSVPFLAGLFAIVGGLGAGAFAYRTRQLERAEAIVTYREFQSEANSARFLLYAPDPEPRQRDEGVNTAKSALSRYDLLGSTNWQSAPKFAGLDQESQNRVRSESAELFIHLARMDCLRSSECVGQNRETVLEQALKWCEIAEGLYPDDRGQQIAKWYRREIRELAAGRIDVSAEKPPERPRGPDTIYMEVGDLILRHDYQAAIAMLRRSDRSEFKDPSYWNLLARCNYELGNYSNAIANYTAGIALQPRENDRLYLGRGNSYLRMKEYQLAADDFDIAIKMRPDDPTLRRDRAQARIGLNDYRGAIADLDFSEKLDAGHTRVYFMRSQVWAKAGDQTAAKKDAEEGLKRTPGDELSWISRGLAKRLRDPNGAIADFDQALTINPYSAPAMQNKANILAEQLGKTQEAILVLDNLIETHPNYINARAGRGVLLARLKKREAAHADARETLKMNDTPFIRYQMACIYSLTSQTHRDDRKEALRLLASALRDKEGLAYVSNDHDLDPIRSDMEFKKLVDISEALEEAAGIRGHK